MTRRAQNVLRFASQEELDRDRAARRERFQRGQVAVPERDVQASVLEYLKRSPRVAWAKRFNTGVMKAENKDGTARFVRFAFPGCSDILGMLRKRPGERVGAFLALEVKSDIGKPTDEQAAFLQTVSAAGGCAGVVRSIDDAHRIIEDFWCL